MKVTRRNNDDAAVAVTAVTEAGEDAAIKSIAEKSIARAARVADELKPSRAVVSIDTIIPKTPPTARCSVEGALVEVPDDDDETDDASPSAKRKRDARRTERELLPDQFDPKDFISQKVENTITGLYDDLDYEEPYILPNTNSAARELITRLRDELKEKWAQDKRRRMAEPMTDRQRDLLLAMNPAFVDTNLTKDEASRKIDEKLNYPSIQQLQALKNMGVPKRLLPTSRKAASAMISLITRR